MTMGVLGAQMLAYIFSFAFETEEVGRKIINMIFTFTSSFPALALFYMKKIPSVDFLSSCLFNVLSLNPLFLLTSAMLEHLNIGLS